MSSQRTGEFVWCERLGYVVVGAPLRTSGAPFVRVECPWCGGDLDTPDQGEGAE